MSTTKGNTIENGLAGNYHLNIKPIFREAWQKVKGIKGIYWGALAIIAAIIFIPSFSLNLVATLVKLNPNSYWDELSMMAFLILKIALFFLEFTLFPGVILIGIRHVTDQSIHLGLLFHVWRSKKLLKNFLILGLLLSAINFVVLFFISITSFFHGSESFAVKITILLAYLVGVAFFLYVNIANVLTVPLIIERELSAWPAFILSIRIVSKHWFRLFTIVLLEILIILASFCTLGIALIWTLPMLNNLMGIVYREIVGVQKKTLDELGIKIIVASI